MTNDILFGMDIEAIEHIADEHIADEPVVDAPVANEEFDVGENFEMFHHFPGLKNLLLGRFEEADAEIVAAVAAGNEPVGPHWMWNLVVEAASCESWRLEGHPARAILHVLNNRERLGLSEPIYDDTPLHPDKVNEKQPPLLAICLRDDAYVSLMHLVKNFDQFSVQIDADFLKALMRRASVITHRISDDAPAEYALDHMLPDEDGQQVKVFRLPAYRDKAARHLQFVFRWALPHIPRELRHVVVEVRDRGLLAGWEAEIEAAFA